MNWAEERYVRVYVRLLPGWKQVPALARGLFDETLRASYPTGEIECALFDPLEALAIAIDAKEHERADLARLFPLLLANGCVEVVEPAGCRGRLIRVPNYRAAQGIVSPAAERMRRYRRGAPGGDASVGLYPAGGLPDGSPGGPNGGNIDPNEVSTTSNGSSASQGGKSPQPTTHVTSVPHPSIHPSIHPTDHDLEQEELIKRPLSPFAAYLRATWPAVRDPMGLEIRFREAFPKVDLLTEAREARLWETTKARQRWRDPVSGLRNWMSNAQRRAPPPPSGRREVVGFDDQGRPIYGGA